MAPLRLQILWLVCGWLMVATIVVLSLVSFGQQVGPSDKLNHFIAYFLLMAWFGALYPRRQHGYVLTGIILLSIAIEGLQGLTAYRQPSLLDVVANAAGAILSWLLIRGSIRPLLAWFERQLFKAAT